MLIANNEKKATTDLIFPTYDPFWCEDSRRSCVRRCTLKFYSAGPWLLVFAAVELPESWKFLGWAWWLIHIVAVAIIFYLGYVVGQAKAEGGESKDWEEDAKDSEKYPDNF